MTNQKLGVVFPESLLNEIERPLEYGDSRSERIKQLTELGMEAESAMKDAGEYRVSHEDRLAVVRQAIEQAAKE